MGGGGAVSIFTGNLFRGRRFNRILNSSGHLRDGFRGYVRFHENHNIWPREN